MKMTAGRIRWMDLAATDARQATEFYGGLFGWRAHCASAAGGTFTRLRLDDEDVGSLYQLSGEHLAQGVPSHWTPYVCVRNLDDSVRRATALGGRCLLDVFAVPGLARIALIEDPGGAMLGLWQEA